MALATPPGGRQSSFDRPFSFSTGSGSFFTDGKKIPTPVDRHIGMRVRMQRRALDTTQHKLAGTIGIAIQQVRKYESGQSRQRWFGSSGSRSVCT
jgi:hypothetical protein